MVSKVGKDLLRNMILHTDSHNKRVEISEMWQQKELCSNPNSLYKADTYRQFSSSKGDRKRTYSDDGRVSPAPHLRGAKKAHMDDELSSTYWARQLQSTEENDPDRWGHGGFKELYPHDFDSDRSTHEKNTTDGLHRKKKHKTKLKHKKSKKKHRHPESDTESSGPTSAEVKSKSKKRKHSNNKKSKRKRKFSESESPNSSDEEVISKPKKKKHSHSKERANTNSDSTKWRRNLDTSETSSDADSDSSWRKMQKKRSTGADRIEKKSLSDEAESQKQWEDGQGEISLTSKHGKKSKHCAKKSKRKHKTKRNN